MISEVKEECSLQVQDALYRAVKYALDRIQTDGDLGYIAGFGTETFRRLCVAEAAFLGQPYEKIETRRMEQRWRREPVAVELRRRLDEIESNR